MKKLRFFSAAVFLLCLVSCSNKELSPYERNIIGTWRLYEVTGSTGYQWYVNPVPANPTQTLTFARDGILRSQGQMLSSNFSYPKYEIKMDDNRMKLELSGSKNNMKGFISSLRIEGDTMQIAPPCFEGCSYGFLKIK